MKSTLFLLLFASIIFKCVLGGNLQARSSETREVVSLDGLWYFTANESYVDDIEEATDLDINLMPVPSSYNDVTTRSSLRDHVGSVWYKRKFYVPSSWSDQRVWIRFGSTCYNASVAINGQAVLTHDIGHLPFLGEITSAVDFGNENTIVVEVNNMLDDNTIPQGTVETLVSGELKQLYNFDFFNYAGIDRPVILYTTSKTAYIDDITILTHLNGTAGLVTYDVAVVGNDDSLSRQVNILDKKGNIVASSSSQNASETLTVENANLWWPYLMDPNPGYLYTLDVVLTKDNTLVDHYKQPFGIRELKFDNDSFTINGKNIYIRGFGRHEDSDIRGKGLDLPLIIRDHNLIKWVGANCYRTSHYPYAEEIMDLADQLGIMIIDEVPSVDTHGFTEPLLENHKKGLTEMYRRDKNRPSVIIWSLANEPRANEAAAEDYFRQVVVHMKSLDTSRPVTITSRWPFKEDYSGQFLDLIAFNLYESWYNHTGELDGVNTRLLEQARGWRNTFNKPVFNTEYGADSMQGLSILPNFVWSEDYQLAVMQEYFKVFDTLRSEGWFFGEMIWAFADFRTDQGIIRVGGNRKGIFTRNREPKRAAFLLRKRYWALANELDDVTPPDDWAEYIIEASSSKIKHTEL